MKIKITGLILLIIGALAVSPFVILIFAGGLMDIMGNLKTFLYLIAGIYFIILGSAIRRHKKWAWSFGITTFSILFISNLIAIFSSFSPYLVVALLLNGFILYVLISEKTTFLLKAAKQ